MYTFLRESLIGSLDEEGVERDVTLTVEVGGSTSSNFGPSEQNEGERAFMLEVRSGSDLG